MKHNRLARTMCVSKETSTLLENVVYDRVTRQIDLDDPRKTENTRASYPLTSISNIVPEGHAGHPRNIIMLTADAFGVLPPVARLSPEQAMYHFLSGYTAKVAGTEKGIKEPEATFSTWRRASTRPTSSPPRAWSRRSPAIRTTSAGSLSSRRR